jgi:hypothetical protein
MYKRKSLLKEGSAKDGVGSIQGSLSKSTLPDNSLTQRTKKIVLVVGESHMSMKWKTENIVTMLKEDGNHDYGE